jgi:membrane-bound lytic murein transglycosylase B
MAPCSPLFRRNRKTDRAVKRPFLLLLLFGALVGAVAPAMAAPPAAADISPEIDRIPVDGLEYRIAQSRLDAASNQLSSAKTRLASSAAELADLQLADTRLTNDLLAQTAKKKQATVTLVASRAGLRALAIETYVRGQVDPSTAVDADVATKLLADRSLTEAVGERNLEKVATSERDLTDAVRTIAADLTNRVNGRLRMQQVEADRQQAQSDEIELTGEVARLQADLEEVRVTSTVAGEDFALVALDAYWRAANAMTADDPACGIPWWALAGITRSESRHGTYGGARLLANGDVNRPIIGIPLDGNNNTAVIGDTDGGTYDGDAVYDRAVGPMQFIPSTWRRWARDGNGDGRADPNNIYDAALAAAHYLCATGPMQTDDQMRRGFFSYNHSDAYAAIVLNYAKGYARFRI